MPPEDLTIFSFGFEIVEKVESLMPELPCIWLVDSPPGDEIGRRQMLRRAMAAGFSGVGFSRKTVDSDLVQRAHLAGLGV